MTYEMVEMISTSAVLMTGMVSFSWVLVSAVKK